MYEKNLQLDLDDFIFPIGKLYPKNAWIKLAKIEKKYAEHFENNVHPAFNVRVALGALHIKEWYKCSEEMTVHQINENPYLQYFIGEKEYTSKCPFSAVSMTRFRKRISVENIQEIIEMTIPKKKNTSEKKDDKTNTKNTDDNPSNDTHDSTDGSDLQDKGDTREENKGVFLLDATCCPIETLSFDAYNESFYFIDCVEKYKEHYGYYPEKVLVDKIYRNRETLSFCNDKGIRITGPALGKPKKDTKVSKEAEYKDSCERNAVV